MLRVVSGALIKDGYVLMGLRSTNGLRPGLWELPGGKVEEDELPQHALAREWREECRVLVEPGAFISTTMLHLEMSFVVDLYEVKFLTEGGRPHADDHQELLWVNPLHAVMRMPCSPAFYLHYPQLQQHIEAKWAWAPSSCDVVGDSGCTNEACSRCHPLAVPTLTIAQMEVGL